VTTGAAVLATRNHGKLRELEPLFAGAGIHVVTLDALRIAESPAEDALECFESFEENALAKARYFHRLTGRPAFADDSGLSVTALGGAPGVRSKRWSGRSDLSGAALDRANCEKLRATLPAAADPAAAFVCAAAYVDDTREVARLGTVAGQVIRDRRGAGGFGYDPYVYIPELGATFAEAVVSTKERVSHRGRAFRALLAELAPEGS
jgi:XTP/dITP diphosphohydrolase